MVADGNNNKAGILDEVLTQFVNAYVQGEQPDIEEFIEQHPQHESQIRRRLGGLREIDALFDSLVRADDSDFIDTSAEYNLVGQKIRSFEIVQMIGRGGMGVVYLARDTKLKRSVAIKSMPAGLAGDSTARMRFRREAELLASMNHPNIAVIYEIIEQDEAAGYLILEYVPGETLAERIAGEPLKLEPALSIGRQIAEALSAAHEKGIVHRDLKPGNIKITPEGRVKVLDFGLAKVSGTKSKASETTASEPGRVMGTPAYMSPEQARGKSTDRRTDIWSFGCVMYQMLTGQLPFEGDTATDMLARIIEREPDWDVLPEDTPGSIRLLLRRCLEKDVERRLGDIADANIQISKTLSLGQLTESKPVTAPAASIFAKLPTMAMIVAATAIIVLSGIALWSTLAKQAPRSSKLIRLVVLPFENFGSTENELFADAITDEMITRLASIHRLSVISRHSTMRYKNTERSVRQIAEELRVDYILDGTILCERPSDPNGPLRISAQLIRAADDTHVWAQAYDSDMREVFGLQSNVAEGVAQALDIKLLEPERNALARQPTENSEAYDLYLRGNEYSSRGYQIKSHREIAIKMYERAVDLDDSFALAHAKLSQAYSAMYHWSQDRSENRLTMALEEANKALELDNELAEAHWALGYYYYWGRSECDRALNHFEIARRSQPNNSRFISAISYAQKWQGKFDQALVNIEKAYDLDPLSHTLAAEAGLVCLLMRNYPEALNYLDRSIRLAPDYNMAYEWQAKLYLRSEGNIREARRVVDKALRYVKTEEDQERLSYLLVDLDVYDGDYKGALDRLNPMLKDVNDPNSHALLRARIYKYMEDEDSALRYFKAARSTFEKAIEKSPDDPSLYRSLGIACAGLGDDEDAIRAGERAVELVPVGKNPWRGTFPVEDLARIYTMVGKYDAAIDQIESLLSVPGRMSISMLRLDPAWDPLRDHARFKELLESDK